MLKQIDETIAAHGSWPTDRLGIVMKNEEEIMQKIAFFKHPQKLWSPKEILSDPKIVPSFKGVYGWYFKPIPQEFPEKNYIRIGDWVLLYIGIAGENPESSATLHSRIIQKHLSNDADRSTLRQSLGSLLAMEDFYLKPLRKGTRKNKSFWFGEEGEERLTEWMMVCARVTWIVDEHPWQIEDVAIREYGNLLPLNIKGNKQNTFSTITLTCIRNDLRDEAWRRWRRS